MKDERLLITPLKALMKDQMNHLYSKEIKSLAIHSGISAEEIDNALENSIFNQLVIDDRHLLLLEETASSPHSA
jgi:superfamily II DNA helicase RecQ